MKLRKLRTDRALGIALSLVLLGLVVYRADLRKMADSLSGVDYRILPVGMAIYMTSFLLRSYRWGVLLGPIKRRISFGRLFSTLIVGWTANNLLPAKAGEMIRAYLIGRAECISKGACAATIVVERAFDGFTLLIFLFASTLLLANPSSVLSLGLYVLAAFLAVLAVLMLLVFRTEQTLALAARVSRKLPGRLSLPALGLLRSFLQGLGALRDPRIVLLGLALSVGVWSIEASVYYLTLRYFGLALPLHAALILLAVVNVGVLLPSAPGALGAFQFFCVVGLSFFGVDESTALGFSVIIQTTMWLPVTTLGLALVWRLPAQLRFRTEPG